MTTHDLKQEVADEIADIDEDLQRHEYDIFIKRLQECIDFNGGHLFYPMLTNKFLNIG